MNEKELKDLESKMNEEMDKILNRKSGLLEKEQKIKFWLNDLQDKKEIEMMASEELKKTECMLFEKENKQYEYENSMKDDKS